MNSLYLIAAGVFMLNESVPLLDSTFLQIIHKPELSCRDAYKNMLKLYDRDAILID